MSTTSLPQDGPSILDSKDRPGTVKEFSRPDLQNMAHDMEIQVSLDPSIKVYKVHSIVVASSQVSPFLYDQTQQYKHDGKLQKVDLTGFCPRAVRDVLWHIYAYQHSMPEFLSEGDLSASIFADYARRFVVASKLGAERASKYIIRDAMRYIKQKYLQNKDLGSVYRREWIKTLSDESNYHMNNNGGKTAVKEIVDHFVASKDEKTLLKDVKEWVTIYGLVDTFSRQLSALSEVIFGPNIESFQTAGTSDTSLLIATFVFIAATMPVH